VFNGHDLKDLPTVGNLQNRGRAGNSSDRPAGNPFELPTERVNPVVGEPPLGQTGEGWLAGTFCPVQMGNLLAELI